MQITPIIPADCVKILPERTMTALMAQEFNSITNCFGISRPYHEDHELLIQATKTEMMRQYGEHRFGDDKYARLIFEPGTLQYGDFDLAALDALAHLKETVEMLKLAGFNRIQCQLESVGENFTGNVNEFHPHMHFGSKPEGSCIYVIADKPTLGVHPDDCEHNRLERFKIKDGKQAFEMPLGHIYRIATAPTVVKSNPALIKEYNPNIHFGQPAGDKILVLAQKI